VSPALRRILVVRLGDLGNCILATPALRALRLAHPRATIDLLAEPVAEPLLAGGDLVDRHIALPRAALERAVRLGPFGVPSLARFALTLRWRGYDAAVLLEHLTTLAGTLKLAAIMLGSGAPRRFGLDNGRGRFLTDRVADGGFGSHHEADTCLRVVALLGGDPAPRRPELPIATTDVAWARAELASLPRPVVAICPGSGAYSVARRWPAERFVEVGRGLAARRGASMLLVGNELELNRAVAGQVGARDVSGRTTLGQLGALLGQVDLLIANDSGVVHVGAAVGAPIVALYGLTDARAWGPYYGDPTLQERGLAVQVELPCRPCLYRRHALGWRGGCATRDCLDLVSPAMVLAAAERQLDRYGAGATG
jgi:heptosyltransferase-2